MPPNPRENNTPFSNGGAGRKPVFRKKLSLATRNSREQQDGGVKAAPKVRFQAAVICLSPETDRGEMPRRQCILKQISRLKCVIFGLIPKNVR